MAYKSSNSKSFGEVVSHWSLLGAGLAANAGDIPHLDGHRLLLQGITTQALGVLSEQKIQAAAKHVLSRRVEILLDQGTKLASFLRAGVKQHYGTRSEKLTEFDLLPFRGKPQPIDPPQLPAPEVAPPQKDAPEQD
jgi:hypothetical protein